MRQWVLLLTSQSTNASKLARTSKTLRVDQFYIRLDDGSLVNVPIDGDRGIPFRKYAKVKIEKTIKASEKVNYAFKEYVQ